MELNEFIKRLFEAADQAGYEAAEVYYASGDEFSVDVKNGEIIDYTASSSMGLGFRALVGGKMGYASTQVLDEDALDLLITGAGENAVLIENEDEEFIFPGSPAYPEISAYNDGIDAVSASEKIEMARALEKETTSIDPRAAQCEIVRVISMSSGKRIVNTRGLDVAFRDNGLGVYAAVIAQEGDQIATGAHMQFVRDPKQLDIKKSAQLAVKDAVAGLDAPKIESGEYHVVLRHDVAGAILETFSSVFSADMAQKGLSLLKGREGEIIASDALSLMDDPTNPASMSATPFDGEGVATKQLAIVENGRLNTLLHNLKTAKKQGVETTGNASKPSYASPIDVAPHVMHVKPGSVSPDELIKMAGSGVLITDVQGLHSGANQISGDFSLGARGFRIENGKVGQAVSQITIAGNFFDLLKNVTAVADNLEFEFGAASPDILIDKMAVAGK